MNFQEYEQRLKNLQNLMLEANVDCTLFSPGINFRYAVKSQAELLERLILAILPVSGTAVLICPAFEKDRLVEESTFQSDQIIIWEEHEDPFLKVKDYLASLALDYKKIAVEPKTWFTNFYRIQNVLDKDIQYIPADFFYQARSQKTPEEIKFLTKACELTSKTISYVFENLKEGMTELEVEKLCKEGASQLGGKLQMGLVQSGPNSSLPHNMPSERKIRKNEVLLIDLGVQYENYYGDITRTTFLGKNPPKRFLEIYEAVKKANEAGLKTAKVGTECQIVDRAARKVLKDLNLDKYFTHRLGHGLGLEIHELPYIVEGNTEKLPLNTIHTIEPGVYLPGEFGIRIEDDVIITKEGAKRLFDVPRYSWTL